MESLLLRHAALAFALLAPAWTGCAGLPADAPRAAALDARRLEGGWNVIASNFPMWLDGGKSNPVFIYRLHEGTSPAVLDDTVAYDEGGRKESILGTDTQDPDNPSHFTWRGNGVLSAFSSDWVIAATGPGDRWIVLYFTKTIATPEGVDVIARTPVLAEADRAEVERLLAGDPFLRSKSRGLVWLKPR